MKNPKQSASRRGLSRLFFVLASFAGMVCVLGGCSTVKPSAPLFVYHEAVPFEVYYPMSIGSSWTYEVREFENGQTSKQSTLLVRVTDIRDGRITLETGSESLTYLVMPDGLMKADSENYLLKMPIRTKANWPLSLAGQPGLATIRNVMATRIVPAGAFQSCLLVEETYALGPDQTLKTRSTYAPNVGLVHLENILVLEGKELLQESVELRIFWKPGMTPEDTIPKRPET